MRAVVTFRGPEAEVLRASLGPEAGREIPRSRVTVRGEGAIAEIVVEAEDTAALRAALNSYLRWAQVAMDARAAVMP
ncbi:MAG TPA: KEOPS complex subunit Pcc1 [Thermoplasmata archaeon]|nr:KEOPS complex subunit Pcc1 [Thermoplasmata archaeon]